MRLSQTVQQLEPSATIAAATMAKELKASGVTVYEFTLGEPDFNTPEHICEAAIRAMRDGKTHYTPATGVPELKQAICSAAERDHGLSYTPSQVAVSNGAKHAIHNVLSAICEPGDEVIVPTPYWVSYSALIKLAGGTPVMVPTDEASGFRMSADQLRAAITDRTRLVMLNNPCNPTGAAYTVENLEALAAVVVENNLLVLSDEIYEKLIYPGSEFRSFATFGDEVKNRTIIVNGVSKAYAMTGWRIGWTIGPETLIKGINKLQSQQTSNPCSVSQYAAIEALTGPQDCISEMLREFTVRREYVLGRLRKIPGVSFAEPGGAFYAFFDISSHLGKPLGKSVEPVTDSTAFCTQLLKDARVGLVTGGAFGADGYVRLSFATGMEVLEAGLDRLESFLNSSDS